jgi:hypothetical protein
LDALAKVRARRETRALAERAARRSDYARAQAASAQAAERLRVERAIAAREDIALYAAVQGKVIDTRRVDKLREDAAALQDRVHACEKELQEMSRLEGLAQEALSSACEAAGRAVKGNEVAQMMQNLAGLASRARDARREDAEMDEHASNRAARGGAASALGWPL